MPTTEPTTTHPTEGPNAMRECRDCGHHDEVAFFRKRKVAKVNANHFWSCPNCGSRDTKWDWED